MCVAPLPNEPTAFLLPVSLALSRCAALSPSYTGPPIGIPLRLLLNGAAYSTLLYTFAFSQR